MSTPMTLAEMVKMFRAEVALHRAPTMTTGHVHAALGKMLDAHARAVVEAETEEPKHAAIRQRVAAATPAPWTIALGSGHNLCTAIVYAPKHGNTVFIADCLPDYAIDEAEKDHRPNMTFIAHARQDVETLLAEMDILTTRLHVAERERDAMHTATKLGEESKRGLIGIGEELIARADRIAALEAQLHEMKTAWPLDVYAELVSLRAALERVRKVPTYSCEDVAISARSERFQFTRWMVVSDVLTAAQIPQEGVSDA